LVSIVLVKDNKKGGVSYPPLCIILVVLSNVCQRVGY
jgi:hypothetical protein